MWKFRSFYGNSSSDNDEDSNESNGDEDYDSNNDIDDEDISVDPVRYSQEAFIPVEGPVCRFFTGEKGCHHGTACTNKHLAENGECLRCHQVLRLADLELHCDQLCELRSNLPITNSSVTRVGPQLTNDSDVESWTQDPMEARHWNGRLQQPSSSGNSSNNNLRSNTTTARMLNRSQHPSGGPSSSTTPVPPSIPLVTCEPAQPRRPTTSSTSKSIPSSSASNPTALWKRSRVCRFHLKGSCNFGASCKFLHLVDDQCVLCEANVSAGPLDRHLQACPEYQMLKAEMQKTEEMDCPICFNRLHEIPSFSLVEEPNSRVPPIISRCKRYDRFALLPDCGHLFCLKCITSWRKETPRPQSDENQFEDYQEGRYLCPICRKETRFIIPCNRVIEGPKRCQREKEMFIHFLLPCRYFERGNCWKGTSCSFAHLSPDGLPVAPSQSRDDPAYYTRVLQNIINVRLLNSPLESILSALYYEEDDDVDGPDGTSGSDYSTGPSSPWHSRTYFVNPRRRLVIAHDNSGGTTNRTPTERRSNRNPRQQRGNQQTTNTEVQPQNIRAANSSATGVNNLSINPRGSSERQSRRRQNGRRG